MAQQYWAVRVIVFRKGGFKTETPIFAPRTIGGVAPENVTYDSLGVPTVNLGFWLNMFEPFIKIIRDNDEGICFDILCPRSIGVRESHTWANMKADKIASFGLNAVAAPET